MRWSPSVRWVGINQSSLGRKKPWESSKSFEGPGQRGTDVRLWSADKREECFAILVMWRLQTFAESRD